MAVISKLDDADLQAICDILGDTSTGQTLGAAGARKLAGAVFSC